MNCLVIGAGQIGQAMHDLLKPFHEVYIRDVEDSDAIPKIEMLHICYPDGMAFVSETKKYIEQYQPSLTIIHSSVALGKTEACGLRVVHCPVRGRHPNLASQIPAFVLFVSGKSKEDVKAACNYLERCGLVTRPVSEPKETELCKLLSNIHLGLEIAWRQEVQRILDRYGVSVETYKEWEQSYNLGYRIVGDEQLSRPILLDPGPIGGHCILECLDILGAQIPSAAFDFIKDSNERAKRALFRVNGAAVANG